MSTFEIVRGVEGDCLVLDGTRICGPKPWGGGRTIDTFRTDGIYEVIDKEEYRKLMAENAKLREQMERLVTLLRVDCDIDASWDGLRRFWSIELTEGGCLMRDRACKAEAENAKLRELCAGLHMAYVGTLNECESLDEGLIWECSGNIDADVAKSRAKFKADRHRFDAALRELGMEK